VTTSIDRIRGHKLLPSDAVVATWPKLYATEKLSMSDKVVQAHFFVGSADWWLVEYDPADNLAFGYVCLGDPDCAEWGYFDLTELGSVTVEHPAGFRLAVERDLNWTPRLFAEVGR